MHRHCEPRLCGVKQSSVHFMDCFVTRHMNMDGFLAMTPRDNSRPCTKNLGIFIWHRHNRPMPETDHATANTAEKLLLKAKHGLFMVPAHDMVVGRSLVKYGEVHESEWHLVKPFVPRGGVVVDAGTHLGTFLVPFAHHVGPQGKVIGFEPQPFIHECLMATIMLNKLGNVTVHPCCVGNETRKVEITAPDYQQEGNYSGLPFTESGYDEVRFSGDKIHTRIVRLDDVFEEPRLDFLKIDVEGMERDVLLGGQKHIMQHRPVIFLENNRRDKSPALVQTLFDMNYRLWWHTGMFFNPENHLGCAENIYGVMSNTNMLCLPVERGDGGVPKTLIECKSPAEHVIDQDGKITPSFG